MKNTDLFQHLMDWKLSDIVDSYGIDPNSEVEVLLNNLIELMIKDVKEE
mgnify:CR=1 FL=1